MASSNARRIREGGMSDRNLHAAVESSGTFVLQLVRSDAANLPDGTRAAMPKERPEYWAEQRQAAREQAIQSEFVERHSIPVEPGLHADRPSVPYLQSLIAGIPPAPLEQVAPELVERGLSLMRFDQTGPQLPL